MSRSVWRVPGMAALGLSTVLGFVGYSALLPVAPLWAVHGGAGPSGAGMVNGALLLATVLTQGFVPRAVRRLGWAPVLVGGMVLLGLPAFLTGLNDALAWILAWSAVRGVGFAVITVCGSTAVAELNQPERRGQAIGAYGLAVAIPNLALLPIGPWLADRFGFGLVFLLSALPLLGAIPALALARALPAPAAQDAGRTGQPGDTREALRRLRRPTLVLLSATLAGGGLVSFLPQMVDSVGLATGGLAVMGLATAASRWLVGGLADRSGPERLLAPLLMIQITGLGVAAASIVSPSQPGVWTLLVALVAIGVGYGALQNLTLVMAFASVPRRQVGMASAVWNVGFDAGTGVASILVGLIAARASFSASVWTLAGIGLLALVLSRRR